MEPPNFTPLLLVQASTIELSLCVCMYVYICLYMRVLCLYKDYLNVFWKRVLYTLIIQHLQNVGIYSRSLPVHGIAGIGQRNRRLWYAGSVCRVSIYGLFRNDAEYFCEQFSKVVEIKGGLDACVPRIQQTRVREYRV